MNTSPPITFAIHDVQTGREAIARIPLNAPQQAAIALSQFLDSLLTAPPDEKTCFQLLEQIQYSIARIAEELAKRYLNKPLPLADVEEAMFQKVISLWLKTAKSYAHCVDKKLSEGSAAAEYAQRTAILLQRSIYYAGMVIIEHMSARRELPSGLWLDLHGYYRNAEQRGVATQVIPDALDRMNRSTHCEATYISFLLCDMAGIYSLSVRDRALVRRWATLWSPLARLHRAAPGGALPQYVVDLMQDVPLSLSINCLQTESLRGLEISGLIKQISQIRRQLGQKTPPSQLGLYDDCTVGQCNRLLEQLSQRWSQGHAPRKFRRHLASGRSKLCTSFEEMHFYISGKVFEQPESDLIYSRREFESLFVFRHQEDPRQPLHIRQEQQTYDLDTWEVVNQSANGFRLVRRFAGKKMMLGQLVALCPHDGERFLLAKITWLMQDKKAGLISGIETLPGMPIAIAARALEHTVEQNGRYQRAFLLPAVPAMSTEQSLILPKGWFRPERTIELFIDTLSQARLMRVLDDGPNYDRVSFVTG